VTGRLLRAARLAGRDALAGLIGGLAATALLLAARLAAGVPLPVELVSDFALPRIDAGTFLTLLNRLGGFVPAKRIAVVGSLAGQVAAAALLGAGYGLLARREPRGRRRAAALGGLLLAVWAILVGVLWSELDASFRGLPPGGARAATAATLAAALATAGAATAAAHRLLAGRRAAARALPAAPAEASGDGTVRRAFLVAGAAGALALVSGGLAGRYWRDSVFGYDGLSAVPPGIAPLTPNDRFYVVTKNLVDPRVDASAWRLTVDGMVREPRSHGLSELTAMPAVTREITLECISNSVGGGLMSNARWRGVPLRTLLGAAGPDPRADQVMLHGADGYTHELALDAALGEGALVAYAMNGEPLPHRHGFPARVLVPGAYGELSVKWVVRIEVQEAGPLGFYSRQGWEADRVRTTSRIDRPRRRERLVAGRPVEVGGVAFAGDRGISAVELSVDGGRTWRRARIDRQAAPTAWALWSAGWTPSRAGVHELVVRAVDGEGTPQDPAERGIAPAGSGGLHRVAVEVTAAR
jgi:DMSO/TMAO reductase YedYZ molybdopterin-dependent catalytic subunit